VPHSQTCTGHLEVQRYESVNKGKNLPVYEELSDALETGFVPGMEKKINV
jgi:hypothetical protein